jgi:putative DNA primase/helicase
MKQILAHLMKEARARLDGFEELYLQEPSFADFIAQAAGGMIRHSFSWGWLVYEKRNGVFIHDDRAGKIVALYIEEMAKELIRATFTLSDQDRRSAVFKFATRILSAKGVKNIKTLLIDREPLAVAADAFDRSPWMINCRGVAVDLRTGEQRPAVPDDLFMKTAGFKPLDCSFTEARKQAPVFVKFIKDITCGRADLADFHLHYLGYCLTGRMDEKIFENHYGATADNGKSTETDTLKLIWGDYACEVPDSVVIKKRDENRFDLAELVGIRLAVKSDVPRGQTLNPKIKEITGGDTNLNAEQKYHKAFAFSPQCKFIINTNDRLKLTEGGRAMETRIALLPYEASFKTSPDRNMREKLKAEGPAILTILIDYARRWYEHKRLPESGTVREASREYILDSDLIASFIAEKCFTGEGEMIPKEALLEAYNAWTGTARKMSKKAFKDAMASHNHREIQAGGGELRGKRCFEGIRLLKYWEKQQENSVTSHSKNHDHIIEENSENSSNLNAVSQKNVNSDLCSIFTSHKELSPNSCFSVTSVTSGNDTDIPPPEDDLWRNPFDEGGG